MTDPTSPAAAPADAQPLMQAYAAAVHAKDVPALLALYAGDVRVFDLWGEWVYGDREALRGAFTGWLGSLGDERVRVGFSEVRVQEVGDLAFLSAFVTYAGESAAGEPLRAMHNRLSWGLRRQGGTWSIVHEHTSAPVDPQTGKVMLQR